MRLAVIFLLVWLVHLAMNWVMVQAELLENANQQRMVFYALVSLWLVYVFLMAIPFVPGIEIGISLMVLRGAEMAPWVYLGTVTGLMLAYLAGRWMPYGVLQRTLADLRLRRAAAFVGQVSDLPPDARVHMLTDRLHGRFGRWLVRWRYLALALLFNLPGNGLIGGGGGISMVAGLSRLFDGRAFALTVILAVSPVPIAVTVFGTDILAQK